MLCAELERLEAEFQNVYDALEEPNLSEEQRAELEEAYSRMIKAIDTHQKSGHDGRPCFEGVEEE